jgi:hypothetical protein
MVYVSDRWKKRKNNFLGDCIQLLRRRMQPQELILIENIFEA